MADAHSSVPDWAAGDLSGIGDPLNDPPEVRAYVGRQPKPTTVPAPPGARAPAEKPRRFPFVGSADFAAGDYRPEWHVSRILVKGQPGVIAGPSKALKTNLSIDLAVSLAAGAPFLGQFDVPKRTRVAVVSGESGPHTLQETARRVCRAKGLELADQDGYLDWCFSLPTFTDLDNVGEFADELAKLRTEAAIIDPMYLSLGDVDEKSMFSVGKALRVVADTLLRVGCTPILVHHANRQLQVGEPMELTHIAYSGLEQFARQFILLNRRERYQGDGSHDLWCNVGGSMGHGGLWSLHVEEGTVDNHFGGREWNVTVQTRGEAQEDRAAQRDREKRELERRKWLKDEAAVLDAIDAVASAGAEAATKTQVRDRVGLSTRKLDEVLRGLLEAGAVEAIEFARTVGQGAKRVTTGYRRPPRREH